MGLGSHEHNIGMRTNNTKKTDDDGLNKSVGDCPGWKA